MCGIIWSDGSYYANLIEDADGRPCKRLLRRGGQRVRGTIKVDPDNSANLGGILF